MSFFKKISAMFSGSGAGADRHALWITVRCNRCSEVIRTRVDLYNDLSAVYGDEGSGYTCRKQIVGEGAGELPCFQRIEVELNFDENRRLVSQEISGGQFVES